MTQLIADVIQLSASLAERKDGCLVPEELHDYMSNLPIFPESLEIDDREIY